MLHVMLNNNFSNGHFFVRKLSAHSTEGLLASLVKKLLEKVVNHKFDLKN